MRRVEAVVTVLVLGLGLALRLWRVELAQFNFDETDLASLVEAWKVHGTFPLVGAVSSVSIPSAPGGVYVQALGLLVSDDPYADLATGVAAGVLALLAVWWVARRWLGPWGAAAAALFYGTAFWAVLLERGVWLPVFLQAPIVLCLDALLVLSVAKRPWALVLACGWLGVLGDVHYTTVVYVVALLPAMWAARRVLRPVHVAAALVVGLIPLVPYLLYEVSPQIRFGDLAGLLGMSGATATVDLSTVISTINAASTGGASGLGGHQAAALSLALGRWTALALFGPLLAAAGLLVAVLLRPRGWAGALIALWTLLPIVGYLRHGAEVLFHYMYMEFPGLALCIGALVAWTLASPRARLLAPPVLTLLGIYAAVSAATLVVLVDFVGMTDVSSGYGIPLVYRREAGRVARSYVPPGGEVLIGDDPRDGEPFRFMVGYDVPSHTFEDCVAVPAEPRAVYLLSSSHTPGSAALQAAGAPLLARIPRPGGDAFLIYGALPAGVSLTGLQAQPQGDSPECQDRRVWETGTAPS